MIGEDGVGLLHLGAGQDRSLPLLLGLGWQLLHVERLEVPERVGRVASRWNVAGLLDNVMSS